MEYQIVCAYRHQKLMIQVKEKIELKDLTEQWGLMMVSFKKQVDLLLGNKEGGD